MITLKRVSKTKSGTFGVLIGNDNLPICVTLENPWLNNLPYKSCIPFGRYTCYKHLSNKFKIETFIVGEVDSRSGIIFHVGNTIKDTLGCILVGRYYTEFTNQSPSSTQEAIELTPGVGESRLALTRMMESLDGLETFILEIRE